MTSKDRIGFMQGRLSPIMDGRIQSFPWKDWQNEFPLAQQNGFHLMEWTLDQDRLYENPLLTTMGQAEIKELCRRHRVQIPSLTGDCFMQAPFWKAEEKRRETLEADFFAIVKACTSVEISTIIIPLVDDGSLENGEQEDLLVTFLTEQTQFIKEHNLRVAFESDFDPTQLARFIARLDPASFGINYDIGNSAALGFDCDEEFNAYGKRIINVHVKDRVLGGTTVPLGTGHSKFEKVFTAIARIGYSGNFILQTARANDDDHVKPLCHYRDMTSDWLSHYAT